MAKENFLFAGVFLLSAMMVSCGEDPAVIDEEGDATNKEIVSSADELEPGEDEALDPIEMEDVSWQNISDINTDLISLNVGEKKYSDAINKLSVRLINKTAKNYDSIFGSSEDDNISISPLSAVLNLAMLANSVDEETCGTILNTFRVSSLSWLNTTCKKLMDFVPRAENGMELVLANSVWYDDAYTLSSAYEFELGNYYAAEVHSTKFAIQQSVSDINAWCAKNTNNLITSIINQPNSDLVAMCINAMYFKNTWLFEFDENETQNQVFKGSKGDKNVPTMHRTLGITDGYFADEWFRFSLPFKGDEAEMIFVLPNEGVDVLKVARTIKLQDLLVQNGEVDRILLDLYLPKFTFKQNYSLYSTLSALGINLEHVNYAPMGINAEGPVNVYQSNVVSINEKGATLASVTFDGMSGDSGEKYRKVTVNVDRPFMYFVRNKVTGTIIMAGVVSNI